LLIGIPIKGTCLACPAPMSAKHHNVQEALLCRYTRVCKVRGLQCVYIALSGSSSQISIE